MRNEKVFRQFEIKISTRICLENTLRAEVSRSRFSVYEVVRVASLLRSWFVYALWETSTARGFRWACSLGNSKILELDSRFNEAFRTEDFHSTELFHNQVFLLLISPSRCIIFEMEMPQ